MKKIYLIFSMILMGATSAFAQGETCATATVITPGVHVANGPSTGGGAANACFGSGGSNSDWYSFTPVCDGTIDVSSDYAVNGGLDSRLSIYSGDCTNLVCEDNDDDGGVIVGFSSVVNNLSVIGGTTYYIEWDDRWGSQGSFEWTLNFDLGGGVVNPNGSPGIYSGVLSWVPSPANETAWDIEWGLSGFQLGAGTIAAASGAGNSFLNITGLNPETTYDFYVAVGGTGCFVGPYSFTTLPLCPPPTEAMTTPGAVDAVMTWDLGFVETSWEFEAGPVGEIIGGADMTSQTVTSPNALTTGLSTCTEYDWYVRAVCDNYTPTIYSNWVGPITYMTECTCPDPSNLSAIEDPTSFFNYLLNWDVNGTETSWNIEYGPVGFLFGQGSNAVANTNVDFNLGGLVPDNTYEFYVQADCGGIDGTSGWVGPFEFTTGTYCPAPSGLGVTNLGTNDAMINWNVDGFSTAWTIEWGTSGFTLGSGVNSGVLSNNAVLTGLTPDTEYCYYVMSNCGSTLDSSSVWAGPYCFSTLAACPAPNNLSVSNVTNTAVTLDWQQGDLETAWNIEWGFPGFMPGNGEEQGLTSTSGIGNSSFYATGLNAAAPYCFYVQADCGGSDGTSTWAGPFCFATLLPNDDPCGAIELLVDGSINLHTNEGGTNNGESTIDPVYTTNWNVHANQMTWWSSWQLNNTTPEAPVWFKFKAPASGKVEVSTANDITVNAETFTEIAVYETGLCGAYSNYNLLGANSYATAGTGWFSLNNDVPGSTVLLCDLNPGQYYYIMLDNITGTAQYPEYDPGTFGISVTDIPAPDAGISTPITICGNGSEVDLFDAIDDYSTTTGVWYNPSAIGGGQFPNLISLPTGANTYSFDYVIANACGADTISTTVTTTVTPTAGMDGSYTTCNTEEISLLSYINGQAEMGGTWVDADGVHDVDNGVFNAYGVQYGSYNFYYIVQGIGTCPADTSTVTITLTDECLGVDGNEVSGLEVYPNPVNDVLTIANLNIDGNATITVFDAQGKMVIKNDVSNNSGNFMIDMTSLEAGVYLIEVNSNSKSEKVRIIKN